MIQVSVRRFRGSILSLSIQGHADPLVCAGVSTVFVGACNALKDIDRFSIRIAGGDSSLEALQEYDEHDATVLETLLVQLQTVGEKYPHEIRIQISEKGQIK